MFGEPPTRTRRLVNPGLAPGVSRGRRSCPVIARTSFTAHITWHTFGAWFLRRDAAQTRSHRSDCLGRAPVRTSLRSNPPSLQEPSLTPGASPGTRRRGNLVSPHADDDGQEISDLTWTPDGRAIVYVRGGGPNRRGEYPNPRSVPKGAEQVVWVTSLSGGGPRRLGEGHAPAVSPKGDRVAFLKQGQVWWAPLADTTGGAAEQLLHARGTARSLHWSPDGAGLAFVSDRGDHAFIAVYDVAAKTLRFLDPSVDSDAEPAWSPDGRRLAFVRVPAGVGGLPFAPERAAQPWSIRVVDVASGPGRQVWIADTGRGSAFREIVAAGQLFWGAGDRIVFPWEKDGWTHLYAVPAQGGPATLLTPGAFEVEHVACSGDRATIVFSSNQEDIDRRHVWRVPVAGGKPEAFTRGTGLEWSPVVTSDGKSIALLHADTRKPPRPAIVLGSGPARDLAPGAVPPDFPEAALVDPQRSEEHTSEL